MTEIKLVKKYPNIRDEDVIEIFQEGYLKGFENGRKNAIPVEWIKKWCNKEHNRKSFEERLLRRYGVITMLEDWEKENGEKTVCIDKVCWMIRGAYDYAKDEKWIMKPLAWALYEVWKIVDKWEKENEESSNRD